MLTRGMEAVGRKRNSSEYLFALLNTGVCGYVIYVKHKQLAEPWGKDGLFNKWCWVCWMAVGRKYILIPTSNHNSVPNIGQL